MVKFNELKISYDNKKLVIDVQLDDIVPSNETYISEISIDTQDTYKDNSPSEQSIKVFTAAEHEKSVRLEVTQEDYPSLLDNNMLFVYVKTVEEKVSGEVRYDLRVTFNTYIVYHQMMQYIKGVSCPCSCDIPKEFIDFYLRLKGLEVCVNTCHYVQACNFYNKYIKPLSKILSLLNCGCNG